MYVPVEGETSAELRANYLRDGFSPVARQIFDSYEDVQSVVLAIAQFYADEAEDAVHLEIIPCVVPNPEWPSCLDNNPFVLFDEGWHVDFSKGIYEMQREYPQLDANTDAIIAFASCCHEISSQEDPVDVTSRPYAVARPEANGTVAVEVVGSVVRPDWEDIFELIDSDDGTNDPRRSLIDAAYQQVSEPVQPTRPSGPPPQRPTPRPGSEPSGKGSFFKRLFGGGS